MNGASGGDSGHFAVYYIRAETSVGALGIPAVHEVDILSPGAPSLVSKLTFSMLLLLPGNFLMLSPIYGTFLDSLYCHP